MAAKATSAGRKRRPNGTADGSTVPIGQLTADPTNPRRRTPRGRELLVRSLKDYGPARSIVVDERGRIIAGNGVAEAAKEAGIANVRIIDAAADELIAVRRRGLTDVEKRGLAIADNRTGELAEWDPEHVIGAREAGVDLRPFWTPEEEAELASKAAAATVMRIAETETAGEPDTAQSPDDVQTFSCGLTVEQERIVRAALRAARAFYGVETTANALTSALKEWTDNHAQPAETPSRRRRQRQQASA